MMILKALAKIKRNNPKKKNRWERVIEIMTEINETGMKKYMKNTTNQ